MIQVWTLRIHRPNQSVPQQESGFDPLPLNESTSESIKGNRPGSAAVTRFAVRALLRDVPIGDVSRLLGHSSVKITEMGYAKWIPARGSRLERLVAKTLMNTDQNGLGNR